MKSATHNRTTTPEMLLAGRPNITVLRTTRARQAPVQTEEPQTRPYKRSGWRLPRFPLVVGMAAVLGVCICWHAMVMPWWSGMQDQWSYGDARITQMDANVGGTSGECHFVAEYYKGAIVIIEIPFADTGAAHVYTLPGITDSSASPVILLSTQKDAATGRTDLLVQVEGTDFETVLYNNGNGFSANEG